jgi:S1-C subfamily serine protease
MSKRSIKLIGWFSAVVLTLGLGVAVGGGAVFALTQSQQADSDANQQPNPEPGMLVASVLPDSPAAQAGITRGDIILKIDDQEINRARELVGYMQSQPSGSQVSLTVLHGDEERVLSATLADRNGSPYLGVVPCGGGIHSVVVDRLATDTGARIINVAPDSPAAQAGLQRGETITAVDGQAINQDNSLTDLIRARTPGDTVTLTVQQPGKEAREVTVTLVENPNEAGQAYLGVRFGPVSGQDVFRGRPVPRGSDRFAAPGDGYEPAIIVRTVEPGSPAESAGLARGDVITAVDGEPIERPRDLAEAAAGYEPGDTITLTVTRIDEDQSREVNVTLGEKPNESGAAYIGVAIDVFFKGRQSGDE